MLTGADFANLGYGPVTASIPFPGIGGKMPVSPMRPVLAGERVMHVGEPVAMVIAATRAQAQDAADLVLVEYEPLDPVIDLDQAARADVTLWPQAPGNVAHDWSNPPDADGAKRKALDETFAKAAHVVSVDLFNQRISAVSMEPRAATGSYDAQADRFTLHTGTQGVAGIRGQVAMCMKIEPAKLRVLTDDVGGGFGMKASSYPEYPALLTAAKMIGQPVHWSGDALRILHERQPGARLAAGTSTSRSTRTASSSRCASRASRTSAPTSPASRCWCRRSTSPSACRASTTFRRSWSMRRRISPTPCRPAPIAARAPRGELSAGARHRGCGEQARDRSRGTAPAQSHPALACRMRRRSGQTDRQRRLPAIFERALAEADYAGFPARRAESEKRGKLRGIGVSGYLEISGGHYHEPARIMFKNGKVVLSIGPASNGQGHATVFRQMIAERLGISDDDVIVTAGDSDRDVPGFGAVASRSAMLVGSAIAVTSTR